MEAGTVYNPTTIASQPGRGRYLDNISYASVNSYRCANVSLVVLGILLAMAGLALVLYGSMFHASLSAPADGFETGQRRHDRRHHEEHNMYQIFVWVGAALLCVGAALWTAYLYRTGRCKYCPLCPGARKRRRLRKHFQTQCLEAGNLTSNDASQPAVQQQEEDQLMQHVQEEPTGLEDTDAMLESGTRPVLRPMQTSI